MQGARATAWAVVWGGSGGAVPPRGRRGRFRSQWRASWKGPGSRGLSGPRGQLRAGPGPGAGGEEGRAPDASPGVLISPPALAPSRVSRLGDFLGFTSDSPTHILLCCRVRGFKAVRSIVCFVSRRPSFLFLCRYHHFLIFEG